MCGRTIFKSPQSVGARHLTRHCIQRKPRTVSHQSLTGNPIRKTRKQREGDRAHVGVLLVMIHEGMKHRIRTNLSENQKPHVAALCTFMLCRSACAASASFLLVWLGRHNGKENGNYYKGFRV